LTVPGEFALHQRTLICWPTRRDLYGEHIGEARRAHAALARTVSGFEPVTMIASPADVDDAQRMCGDGVEVVGIPIDDSWVRDSGPIYAIEDASLVAQDWIFNGWGNKFTPFDDDAKLASRWAVHAGHRSRSIDMVLEGGSITVDGTTLVTTEQCLLNPNRNPHLDRGAIESRLREELGVSDVVWLPHGLSMDDDTDGHVDNVAAFVGQGSLVVQGCSDMTLVDHQQLNSNRTIAERRGLTVREIPVLPVVEWGGRMVQVPYLNFYLVNGGVIVPVCGHVDDDEMLALLAEFVPDREVVGLDIGGVLAYGGGGIHCITQQIPAL
jgi:agmatine deiminase